MKWSSENIFMLLRKNFIQLFKMMIIGSGMYFLDSMKRDFVQLQLPVRIDSTVQLT